MLNERWSSEKEINKVLKPCHEGASGPVLMNKYGKNMVYDGEGHTQYIGMSGSGKSWCGTILLVRTCTEAKTSFIVADSKGEIYEHTACYAKEKGYKIKKLNFRDVLNSDCYNPLSAIYELMASKDPAKVQIALEMIDELSYILYPLSDKADPFWIESARTLFVGICYALMEYGTKEQATLESIYQFVAKGEERFGGPNNNFLKEFVSLLPDDSIAAMMLKSYTTTASETAAGIRSTFLEGISMFARSEGLMSMLGNDDIHLNELDGETPTAIYIILPDEHPIYDKIAGCIVSQMTSHYIRIAHDKYNGKLPRCLNVILEELGNIGQAIPNLPHLMTAARSRNIRMHIVLQSLSQLDTIYGSSKATTITSNADVTVAYRINNWETLAELSRKCGEREIECNGYRSREALITPSQLGAMQTGQALVMISGRTKFITWLPGYDKMFDCSKWKAPENKKYSSKPKPDTFKIDVYVKEEKRKKMERMMNSSSGGSSLLEAPSPFPGSTIPTGFFDCRTTVEQDEVPQFNVDELVKKIDAKIAELEAQEEEEKKEQEKQIKKFKVVLVDVGEQKTQTIKTVHDLTELDLRTVMEKTKNLPYVMEFNSKYKAKQAMKKLAEVGATVKME